MVWGAIAAAAASAYSASEERKASAHTGGGMGPAPITPVNVNVGGLNVPAFPDFPRLYSSGTGQQTIEQPVIQQVSDNKFLYLAGAGVLIAFILKKF
jgi:hypothetical protein